MQQSSKKTKRPDTPLAPTPVVRWADNIKNPENKEFVREVAFNKKKIGKVTQDELAGAKLLIVGGDKYTERPQPAMNEHTSAGFKKLLLETTEGMAKQVFVAELSNHCESDREHSSCKLHLTRAVSYVG